MIPRPTIESGHRKRVPAQRTHGAMLVSFAIGVVALVALGALLVDLRIASSSQQSLQLATDVAAIESTRALTWTTDVAVHRAAADQAVRSQFGDPLGSGGLPTVDATDDETLLGGVLRPGGVVVPTLAPNNDNDPRGDIVSGVATPVLTDAGIELDVVPSAIGDARATRVTLTRGVEATVGPEVQSTLPPSPAIFARASVLQAAEPIRGIPVRATSLADLDVATSVTVADGTLLRRDVGISIDAWSLATAGATITLEEVGSSAATGATARVGEAMVLSGVAATPVDFPETFCCAVVADNRAVAFIAVRADAVANAFFVVDTLPVGFALSIRRALLDPLAIEALRTDSELKVARDQVRANTTSPRLRAPRLIR